MRPIHRHLLIALAVPILIAAGLAGGMAVADSHDDVYTACLSAAGKISNVAIGSEPATPGCGPKETQISWNASGPAGPAGPPGSAGVLGFYVAEGGVPAPDLPDDWNAPVNTYEQSIVDPGDLTVSCDPGDAAVGGSLLRRNVSQSGSGTEAPVDLVTSYDFTTPEAFVVMTTDGVPTGYTNVNPISASMQWSVFESPPGTFIAFAGQNGWTATVTCADLTP